MHLSALQCFPLHNTNSPRNHTRGIGRIGCVRVPTLVSDLSRSRRLDDVFTTFTIGPPACRFPWKHLFVNSSIRDGSASRHFSQTSPNSAIIAGCSWCVERPNKGWEFPWYIYSTLSADLWHSECARKITNYRARLLLNFFSLRDVDEILWFGNETMLCLPTTRSQTLPPAPSDRSALPSFYNSLVYHHDQSLLVMNNIFSTLVPLSCACNRSSRHR